MAITNKETWVVYALNVMRTHLIYCPRDVFTAESFGYNLGDYTKPEDTRWWGAVFQRAKRDGIIKQLCTPTQFMGITGDAVPVTSPTVGRHRTPVWVKA